MRFRRHLCVSLLVYVPKEEVLLLGWGVPMPLPVRSRRYDETFWKELLGKKGKKKSEDEINKELGY